MAHIIRNVLGCRAQQLLCSLENGWTHARLFVPSTNHTLMVWSHFHFHFLRRGLLCMEAGLQQSFCSWAVFLVLSKSRLIHSRGESPK